MGNLVLNSQTVLTQTGTNTPEIANPVLNKSLTELDIAASNGATSNLDNTALPLFGCRAFVNFESSSTTSVTVNNVAEDHCAIRASGNVSKVVKKATGDFEIHFENAMPDNNYAAFVSCGIVSGGGNYANLISLNSTTSSVNDYYQAPTTLSMRFVVQNYQNSHINPFHCYAAIFR